MTMKSLTTEEPLQHFSIKATHTHNAEGESVSLVELLAQQAEKKAQNREEMKKRVKAVRAAKAPMRARVALMKARIAITEIRAQKAQAHA